MSYHLNEGIDDAYHIMFFIAYSFIIYGKKNKPAPYICQYFQGTGFRIYGPYLKQTKY